MTRRPPAPWSLEWTSSGELAPLDRQDLFLVLCQPGVSPNLSDTSGRLSTAVPSFALSLGVMVQPRSLPTSS